MATCFGGIGDTSIEDPRTQESDNGSENEFQDEDAMRQVLAKTKILSKKRTTNQEMPYKR